MTDPSTPVLEVRNASIRYPGAAATAVADVSLQVRRGEILGLIGESGCGKSSTARALLGLVPLASGQVLLHGQPVRPGSASVRTAVQAVFQNPAASFNPKRSLLDSVAEPLRIHGIGTRRERSTAALDILARVGIDDRTAKLRPAQVSGGQCQRAAIARAIIRRPEVLICDEPVSALDVSIQAQILHLLAELRAEFGLAMLLIAHDLNVVANLCDRTAVMYAGRVVETGASLEIAHRPLHPYSHALKLATPRLDADAPPDPGSDSSGPVPLVAPAEPDGRLQRGCSYRMDCGRSLDICSTVRPELRADGHHREVACHAPVPPALV